MRRATLFAATALAAAALIAGCTAGPTTSPPAQPGSATTSTAASPGAGGPDGSGQRVVDLEAYKKNVAALTSGWIDAYSKSDADDGKAAAAYAKEHGSGRFQNEWVSGDMTYIMRSYAVTGVQGDARTAKVTVRYDITSLREPVTTPGGKPTYRSAPAFDVTYTWIKTPSGWQLDRITKTSDGSDFGAPVVYGK
jgi:hypothetical protein